MKGHVVNKGKTHIYSMKRRIAPGDKVLLSDLYEQYGPKHYLDKDESFIEWLKEVKLKDKKDLQIEVE